MRDSIETNCSNTLWARRACQGVAADGTSLQSPHRRHRRLVVLVPTCSPTPRISRPGRSGEQQPPRRRLFSRLMPYLLSTRRRALNCGAPSVLHCELDSGLLRRVLPLNRNSGVGSCSCWPHACSCIGSRAMQASPPTSWSGAAIPLGEGCGRSTKPHKPPAHPSPPPGLRRPRMLGGLLALLR